MVSVKLKWSSLRFVVIGIFLMIISSLIEIINLGNGFNWATLEHTILLLTKEVGIALFIIGSISIIIELSDFTEYIIKRLTDIVINNAFLDLLTIEQMSKLKTKIHEKLYFTDQPHDPESFFYTVENRLVPLLRDYYYNEYTINIECWIEDSLIRKKIHRRIELFNPRNENLSTKISIEVNMQAIENIDNENLFKIISFKIDSIDRTNELNLSFSKISGIDDEKYNLKVSCAYEINFCDTCVIEQIYETLVPISDIHYTNRVLKPCKRYSISFFVYSDNYFLKGYGFGFLEHKKLVKTVFSKGMKIQFLNWILPGDGVIFTLLKGQEDPHRI